MKLSSVLESSGFYARFEIPINRLFVGISVLKEVILNPSKSEEENSEETSQEIVSPECYIKHPLQNRLTISYTTPFCLFSHFVFTFCVLHIVIVAETCHVLGVHDCFLIKNSFEEDV